MTTNNNDHDDWDLDSAELRQPRSKSDKRVVISVSLNSEDFKMLTELADRARMKLSTYLREMALRQPITDAIQVVTQAGYDLEDGSVAFGSVSFPATTFEGPLVNVSLLPA